MTDKFLFLLLEGFRNLWRHKLTAATAIFSVFLTLFLIGTLFIAGHNSHQVIRYLRSKYKIEVFYLEKVSNEEAVQISETIKEIDGVLSATVIFKEDAMYIFKDQFGEDIMEMLGYNPLPASCVVNVDRESMDPMNVDAIIEQIWALDGVDQVNYQGRLIRKVERFYQRVSTGLPFLAGGILLIAVFIINNTIRLTVFSKRDLIRALQLIGATKSFIKIPFILEGVFEGLIATALTYPALVGMIRGGNYLIDQFTSLSFRIHYDPLLVYWLIGVAVLISVVGSYRAISKILV